MAKQGRKAQRNLADLQLATAVIAARLPIILAESMFDKGSRPEKHLAISEKTSAAFEGLIHAQLSIVHSASTFWLDVLGGRSPDLLMNRAFHRALAAFERPGRGTLRANYRRLLG